MAKITEMFKNFAELLQMRGAYALIEEEMEFEDERLQNSMEELKDYSDEELILIWMEELHASNPSILDLVKEIKEVDGTIDNEFQWALGSVGEEVNMHLQNIQNLRVYQDLIHEEITERMKGGGQNVFRFYDKANIMSGICLGENKEAAQEAALKYILATFTGCEPPEVVVWEMAADDDFNINNPTALAVAY